MKNYVTIVSYTLSWNTEPNELGETSPYAFVKNSTNKRYCYPNPDFK